MSALLQQLTNKFQSNKILIIINFNHLFVDFTYFQIRIAIVAKALPSCLSEPSWETGIQATGGVFIILANTILFPYFLSRGTHHQQEAMEAMEELDQDASGSG